MKSHLEMAYDDPHTTNFILGHPPPLYHQNSSSRPQMSSLPKLMKAIFPPSPPLTDKWDSDSSSISSDEDGGSIPLPLVSIIPKEILPVDLNSPDKHVARDPRLIRLTGNHPFNSEAPLTELFDAG